MLAFHAKKNTEIGDFSVVSRVSDDATKKKSK
jgi:hypothetical protein